MRNQPWAGRSTYLLAMRFSRLADLAARLSGWPRRIIALIFLLLAAGAALTDRAAAPAAVRVPTTPVVVSSADLAVGTVLRADQLRVVAWPTELRPAGGFVRTSDLTGQRLAGPTRSGEAMTRTRLAGPDLAAGLPSGFIATPAPVTAGSTTFVHPGNRADLIAPAADNATSKGPAHVVADQVLVLAVLPPDDGPTPTASTTIVVAARPDVAARIATETSVPLVALVRGPP
jgi:Flp pilus assembly protein CpaB